MNKLYKPTYERSIAICIGIDKYVHLQPLDNCVAGMQEVAETFLKQGYNVETLYDKDATGVNIKGLLENLSGNIGEDDRIFIYFAGHGLRRKNVSQEDVGLLSTYDTEENFSGALFFQEIIARLQFVKAKHIFFAIDACFSGLALIRTDEMETSSEDDPKIISRNLIMRRAFEILTAGGQSEFTYDRFPYNGPARLSPFTYFLTLGLRGEGSLKNFDGFITGRSLANYVRTNVQLFAPGQIPQYGIVPGSEGEFVFQESAQQNPETNSIKEKVGNNKGISIHNKVDYITNQILQLYLENWEYYKCFLDRLDKIVGRRSNGSHLRILQDSELFNYFGFKIDEDEHTAYKVLLESPSGDIEIESSKSRMKMYFRRIKNVLDRFPLENLNPSQLARWKYCIDGVIDDLGSKDDDSLIIRRIEDFAKSTLALTRFTTTAHDPELKAALYLIKKLDFTDKGGSQKVERYLLEKIRREMEDSVDFTSKSLFTEYLDDESNFWWGLLVLMDHSIDDFRLHDYRGLSGAEQILEKLIGKGGIVSSSYGIARKEVVFEIHSEYETILWINNLGFLISQLLERKNVKGLPVKIREYILGLQEPYIFAEKIRPTGNIFIVSLELEVWGRILAWTKGTAKDHLGRDVNSQGPQFLIRN